MELLMKLFFVLFPLIMTKGEMLSSNATSIIDDILVDAKETFIRDCMQSFDKMKTTANMVKEMSKLIENYEQYIPNERVQSFNTIQKDFMEFQAKMTNTAIDISKDIRSGKSDLDNLISIIEQVSNVTYTVENIKLEQFRDIEQLANFIDQLWNLNVTVISKLSSLKTYLMNNQDTNVYVLKFNINMVAKDRAIFKKFRYMSEHKDEYGQGSKFAAITFDILNRISNPGSAVISKYRDEELLEENIDQGKSLNKTFVWKVLKNRNDPALIERISETFEIVSWGDNYPLTFFARLYFNQNFTLMAKAHLKRDYISLWYTNNQDTGEIKSSDANIKVHANGQDYNLDHIEFLANPDMIAHKWVKATVGVPQHAVVCGDEFGQVYYCGRMYVVDTAQRGLIPVKIKDNIPYGHFQTVRTGSDFQYLVYEI